jgi:CheY-like chemotaxis protein
VHTLPNPLSTSTASEIVASVSNYLWPLLTAVVVWKLLPVIREVIRTRSYKITVGSLSVDVQTASEAMQKQIADLQNQVARLNDKAVPASQQSESSTGTISFEPLPARGRLLWVDDNPDNNVYEIQSLEEKDVVVTTVTSTEQALGELSRRTYDAVITDMGRKEGGSFNGQAGLELVKAVHQKYPNIGLYVFTTGKIVRNRQRELLDAGATGVTSSSVQLLAMLRVIGGSEGK